MHARMHAQIQTYCNNKYILLNYTFHYDTRKHYFSVRIVNIWNSLSQSVVDVDTVCLFKARLDKFWNLDASRCYITILRPT